MASFCKPYSKKGKVMAYPHIISALSTKLSQIQGEIELHHKAIKELEIKSKALKQSLLIFDESFDISMIKTKCKRTRYCLKTKHRAYFKSNRRFCDTSKGL